MHNGDHDGGSEEHDDKQVHELELSHSQPGGTLALLAAVSTISLFPQVPPKKQTSHGCVSRYWDFLLSWS